MTMSPGTAPSPLIHDGRRPRAKPSASPRTRAGTIIFARAAAAIASPAAAAAISTVAATLLDDDRLGSCATATTAAAGHAKQTEAQEEETSNDADDDPGNRTTAQMVGRTLGTRGNTAIAGAALAIWLGASSSTCTRATRRGRGSRR